MVTFPSYPESFSSSQVCTALWEGKGNYLGQSPSGPKVAEGKLKIGRCQKRQLCLP